MTPLRSSLIVFALSACAGVDADHVRLANGNELTGKVRSISPEGRVTIESPNAVDPFLLRSSALRTLDFSGSEELPALEGERLHLTNDDMLPGRLVSLDEQHVGFETAFAGNLRIPRTSVRSLDFGVSPQKLLYRGPTDLSIGWVDNNDWSMEDGRMVCRSNGAISRPDTLSGNFILRFRLSWEQNPNLRFYFCDDLMERRGDGDRYYLEINVSGLQLKRQTRHGERRWYTLHSLDRRPDEFEEPRLEAEVRVDRENRVLHLYLNGEKEGSFHDPIDENPEGSGIMLYSLAGGDMKNIIELIEIYEWDAVSQMRRTEGHKDHEQDSIISSTGERFSGVAKCLVDETGEPRILFRSPHADEPFRIPQRRISTLYFRKTPSAKTGSSTAFACDLEGGGNLHLEALRLDSGFLTAKHSLLGEISIQRSALRRISNTPGTDSSPPGPDDPPRSLPE